MASAATHLHNFDPPIIHRDLKSLNLLLTEPVADQHVCPFVKLCDFGFARVHEELLAVGAPMTKGAGTSHWMAPEVYLGTNYSEKADIFSFAMIMYETISRHVPFEKLDPTAASRNISTAARPPRAPGRLLGPRPRGAADLSRDRGAPHRHQCPHARRSPGVRPSPRGRLRAAAEAEPT